MIKKSKKNISPQLKKLIWELYIGKHTQKAHCPLCQIQLLDTRVNSGFEAAHIVAERYFDSTFQTNELYLFPTCDKCNNECADTTIFDYLWCRARFKELESMISAVFNRFIEINNDTLVDHHRLAPMVLEHLYGQHRFRAGGGIINKQQIYKIALIVQFRETQEKSAKLVKELKETTEQLEMIAKYKVQTQYLDI